MMLMTSAGIVHVFQFFPVLRRNQIFFRSHLLIWFNYRPLYGNAYHFTVKYYINFVFSAGQSSMSRIVVCATYCQCGRRVQQKTTHEIFSIRSEIALMTSNTSSMSMIAYALCNMDKRCTKNLYIARIPHVRCRSHFCSQNTENGSTGIRCLLGYRSLHYTCNACQQLW